MIFFKRDIREILQRSIVWYRVLILTGREMGGQKYLLAFWY